MTSEAIVVSGMVYANIGKTHTPTWENIVFVPAAAIYIDRKPVEIKRPDDYIELLARSIPPGANVLLAHSYNRYGEIVASALEKRLRHLEGVEANFYRAIAIDPDGAIAFGPFLSSDALDAEIAQIWYSNAFMFDLLPDQVNRIPLDRARMLKSMFSRSDKSVPNINPEGASATTAILKTMGIEN